MLSQEEKETYNRHIILDEVGETGQLRLKNSRVLVIGAGGLGCPVLLYLNAAGIGKIGIVDFDQIDKSNLQRQVLFDIQSIGNSKAQRAKEKLEAVNPHNSIQIYKERINVDNALNLIKNYDIVVDCTDNYETRYLVNDACVLLEKPLIYAAIFKYEGQVSVFNYKNGPTYRCVYPSPPKSASITNCSESGVIGVLAGIIGTMQANEVIKLILGIGEPLSGKLSVYSSLTCQISNFKISKQQNTIYEDLKSTGKLNPSLYSIQSCSSENILMDEIEIEEFHNEVKNGTQLIDVREIDEEPKFPELRALNLPLSSIDSLKVNLENKRTIVFCKSGIRSQKAIKILQQKYQLDNLINLKNGIQSYQQLK